MRAQKLAAYCGKRIAHDRKGLPLIIPRNEIALKGAGVVLRTPQSNAALDAARDDLELVLGEQS
jgi:hypothetical protein